MIWFTSIVVEYFVSDFLICVVRYLNIQCINVCLCLRFTSTTLFPTSRCSTFHDLPNYPLHEYGLLKGLRVMFVLCEPRSGLSSTPLPLEQEIPFGNHDCRFHFNFHGCSLFKDIFMMIFEILDIFCLFLPQHSS